MKIDNNYTPTFKAKYINSIKIGKFAQNTGKYTDEWVSFVKIDIDNFRDLKALEYAAKYWENDKFASNIYHAACSAKNKVQPYTKDNIYALTEQKGFFEELEGVKILGLVHLSPTSDNAAFIEHLQAKPSMIYRIKPRFKGIGSGILTSLKEIFNKISCIPLRDKSVKNFYKKNDFVPSPIDANYYIWYKA